MFGDFDFSSLNDPEFKEDAVREVIVFPIIAHLGYSSNATAPSRVVRSKQLAHPFVYIGTRKYGINIIPDYTFFVDAVPRWILDAKSPTENITRGKNLEQAFSYAIHPDIRTKIYALCNGRSLVLFHVSKTTPLLIIETEDLSNKFTKLFNLVSPNAFRGPTVNFAPDCGLYLRKIGATPDLSNHFYGIGLPNIARMDEDNYTCFVKIKLGDDWLGASFDFHRRQLKQLLTSIDPTQAVVIHHQLRKAPFKVHFDVEVPAVNIEARVSSKVIINQNE